MLVSVGVGVVLKVFGDFGCVDGGVPVAPALRLQVGAQVRSPGLARENIFQFIQARFAISTGVAPNAVTQGSGKDDLILVDNRPVGVVAIARHLLRFPYKRAAIHT